MDVSGMMKRPWLRVWNMYFVRRFVFLAVPLFLLWGCAQFIGEHSLSISQTELQSRMATHFPLQRKVLEVFQFTVDTPVLTLQPEAHRVATRLSVLLEDRLQGREYRGSVNLGFGLRFDPEEQGLRMVNVSVDSLQIEGLSHNAQKAVALLGPMLAQEKLEDQLIYRFKPEDLRRASLMGYSVSTIDVTPQGVSVRLAAKP
jgi:hypothetical protein